MIPPRLFAKTVRYLDALTWTSQCLVPPGGCRFSPSVGQFPPFHPFFVFIRRVLPLAGHCFRFLFFLILRLFSWTVFQNLCELGGFFFWGDTTDFYNPGLSIPRRHFFPSRPSSLLRARGGWFFFFFWRPLNGRLFRLFLSYSLACIIFLGGLHQCPLPILLRVPRADPVTCCLDVIASFCFPWSSSHFAEMWLTWFSSRHSRPGRGGL